MMPACTYDICHGAIYPENFCLGEIKENTLNQAKKLESDTEEPIFVL